MPSGLVPGSALNVTNAPTLTSMPGMPPPSALSPSIISSGIGRRGRLAARTAATLDRPTPSLGVTDQMLSDARKDGFATPFGSLRSVARQGFGVPAPSAAASSEAGLMGAIDPSFNAVDAAIPGKIRSNVNRLNMIADDIIRNRPDQPDQSPPANAVGSTEQTPLQKNIENAIDMVVDNFAKAQAQIGTNSPLQQSRKRGRISWFSKDTGRSGIENRSRTQRIVAALTDPESPFWFRWNQFGAP
jgi:hypothetical protein